MSWTGTVAFRRDEKYQVLVRLLGRQRLRWEDNIGIDLREIGWEGVGWIHLIQDREHWWDLVSIVMNLQVP
jgi:hypothetical protein